MVDNITSAFYARGASSFDPRFPPQHALAQPDGDDSTRPRGRFWATSGLYPQFINISLQSSFRTCDISSLSVEVLGAYTLKVVCVDNSQKTVCELSKSFGQQDNQNQFIPQKFQLQGCAGARAITFYVSGWSDFCAIRGIQITGSAISRVPTLNIDTALHPKEHHRYARTEAPSLQPMTTSPERPWSADSKHLPVQSKAASVSVNLFGSSTGVDSKHSFLVPARRKLRGRKGRKNISRP